MCRSLPLGRKLQQEWPRDGPSGKPFHSAHSAAFTLVSVCSLILMRGSPPGMGGRQGSVTAGSRGGSAAGGEARRLACSQEQRQAAAWELLRLLPRHAAMVRALGSDCDCPADLLAPMVVDNWRLALELVRETGDITSREQLAAWVAAMEAGLQLQPLLQQLDTSWLQLSREQLADPKPAAKLAGFLLRHVWEDGARRAVAWAMPPGDGAAPGQLAPLARQLWQLHSTSCRLLHWAAAGREEGGMAAAQLNAAGGWGEALHVVHVQMLLTLAAATDAEQADQPTAEKCRCETLLCTAPHCSVLHCKLLANWHGSFS